jgi:hypothetical protein
MCKQANAAKGIETITIQLRNDWPKNTSMGER